jgi:hypothetical protein
VTDDEDRRAVGGARHTGSNRLSEELEALLARERPGNVVGQQCPPVASLRLDSPGSRRQQSRRADDLTALDLEGSGCVTSSPAHDVPVEFAPASLSSRFRASTVLWHPSRPVVRR